MVGDNNPVFIGPDGNEKRPRVDADGKVIISNPTANPETGLAKEATLAEVAQDDTVILLRRIVRLLESNATVDIANRQKITLDSMTAGALANAGVGVGNLCNTVRIAAPGTVETAYPLHIWEGPVDQRWRVMEDSRISYQLGIRSHLSFT